jgi:hypothetical protein
MAHSIANRLAAAYMHPKLYCIDTWCGYGLKRADPKGVSHILPAESDTTALGVALVDAVTHSRILTLQDAQDASVFGREAVKVRYDAWVARLLQSAGLKTRKSLFKDLKFCEVTDKDGLLVIEPRHHVKLEAWQELASGPCEITVPIGAPSPEVGAALLRAFELCT